MVGRANGMAADAGLRAGDEILRIGDRETPTWTDVQFALAVAGLDRARVPVEVRNAEGDLRTRALDLAKVPADFDELRAADTIGLTARHRLQAPVIFDPAYARRFNAAFAQAARTHAAPFLPDFLAGVSLNPRLNQADGIHPNAAGVAVIARRLAPLVVRTLGGSG